MATTADINPAAVEAEARRLVEAAGRLGITLERFIWYREDPGGVRCACPATVKALNHHPEIGGVGIMGSWVRVVIGLPATRGLAEGFDGYQSHNDYFEDDPDYHFYFAVGRRVAELAGLAGGPET